MKLLIGLALGLNKVAMCCIDDNCNTVNEAILRSDPGAIVRKIRNLTAECAYRTWSAAIVRIDLWQAFRIETAHFLFGSTLYTALSFNMSKQD